MSMDRSSVSRSLRQTADRLRRDLLAPHGGSDALDTGEGPALMTDVTAGTLNDLLGSAALAAIGDGAEPVLPDHRVVGVAPADLRAELSSGYLVYSLPTKDRAGRRVPDYDATPEVYEPLFPTAALAERFAAQIPDTTTLPRELAPAQWSTQVTQQWIYGRDLAPMVWDPVAVDVPRVAPLDPEGTAWVAYRGVLARDGSAQWAVLAESGSWSLVEAPSRFPTAQTAVDHLRGLHDPEADVTSASLRLPPALARQLDPAGRRNAPAPVEVALAAPIEIAGPLRGGRSGCLTVAQDATTGQAVAGLWNRRGQFRPVLVRRGPEPWTPLMDADPLAVQTTCIRRGWPALQAPGLAVRMPGPEVAADTLASTGVRAGYFAALTPGHLALH